MIIGIDGNEANVEKKLGVGEYAFRLLECFHSLKLKDIRFRIYLKQKKRPELPQANEFWDYRVIGPKTVWTQTRLPFDLYTYRPRPDVFFTPTHYAPRFSPVPTVISVLDLSYIFFPELFRKKDLYKLKAWTEYSVKNAVRILTISQSSKDDIIKYYKVPGEKVGVTYLGIKDIEAQKNMSDVEEKYNLSSKFILFVGTLQPRKNIERLIEAFSHVQKKHNDLKLIIIGKKGWLFESILLAPEKFHVAESVRFLDFVPDEDLPAFYKKATCFILPSLYEGFGLPVLEAMKHGCPVVTSNVSSLPEAGGDAALYIDPYNIEDIASKIEELVGSKKLREELIEKGHKQVKKFSWEKAAKETLEILEEVGNNRSKTTNGSE